MGSMKAALDIALFSLRKVGPVVSKLWTSTKDYIANTKAKPLVCNPIVEKAESALDNLHETLISKCVSFRARLLPKELENLEREVERLKKEIEETKKSISKNLKPKVATAWRYAKVEMIPPMTSHVFQGPFGRRIENTASNMADNFIAGIHQKLKDIEDEKMRIIKEKEAAIKAAVEKAKALKRAQEQKRIETEKAAAAAKAQKAKAEAMKVAKKEESTKAATAKTESKKKTKRVAPKSKKRAKTTRRKVKKGSAPKPRK